MNTLFLSALQLLRKKAKLSRTPLPLLAVVCLTISCDSQGRGGQKSSGSLESRETPYGFTLQVPQDWETRELGAFFVSPREGITDDFLENLGIDLKQTPDATLDEFAGNYFGSTKGDPDLVSGDIEMTSVLGREAQYRATRSVRKQRTYAQWLIQQGEGEFIVFTATILDTALDQYLPVFRQMVESAQAE